MSKPTAANDSCFLCVLQVLPTRGAIRVQTDALVNAYLHFEHGTDLIEHLKIKAKTVSGIRRLLPKMPELAIEEHLDHHDRHTGSVGRFALQRFPILRVGEGKEVQGDKIMPASLEHDEAGKAQWIAEGGYWICKYCQERTGSRLSALNMCRVDMACRWCPIREPMVKQEPGVDHK